MSITVLEPDAGTLRRLKALLLELIEKQVEDEKEYSVPVRQALSIAYGLLGWVYGQEFGGGYTTSIHKSYEGLPSYFDFRGPAGALPELYALFTELDNWFNPRDGGDPVRQGPTRDALLFDDENEEPYSLGTFLDELREKTSRE